MLFVKHAKKIIMMSHQNTYTNNNAFGSYDMDTIAKVCLQNYLKKNIYKFKMCKGSKRFNGVLNLVSKNNDM